MSDALVVRPGGDPWANDLAAWGGTVVGLFSSFPQHSLTADINASHPAIAHQAQARLGQSRAAFFFCHGAADALFDNQNTQYNLLDLASASITSGKIVLALACDSARTLGPACIARGADAYLGFDDALAWLQGDPHGKFSDAARAPCAVLLAGGNQAFLFYSAPPAGVPWQDAVIGKLTAWWDLARFRLHGNGFVTL